VKILGFEITRAKAAVAAMSPANTPALYTAGRGGWFPLIREGFAGAWQRGITQTVENVLTFTAAFACVTLIASDIGKLRPRIVRKNSYGIWEEELEHAYTRLLEAPNSFQTRIRFFESWMLSKLISGNTFVLLQRDRNRKVEAMYVLDPARCRALVAPDGGVYYAIGTDNLSRVPFDLNGINAVPASEIIHDVANPLYHPLVGVSPISACGLAAIQGLRVQTHSAEFFANAATPSGLLSTPQPINQEQAEQLQRAWLDNYGGVQNTGKVAVLGGGLTYQPTTMTATDSQLIEQLKMSAEMVVQAFRVPGHMVGVGPMPTFNNIESLTTQYYTQTLQNPIESIELLLDRGLGLERGVGTEFDLDDLLRMDTANRVKAAADAVGSGAMSPNEARGRYLDLGPTPGGDACYLQVQNYSLAALDARDRRQPAPDTSGGNLTATPAKAESMAAEDVPVWNPVVSYRRGDRVRAWGVTYKALADVHAGNSTAPGHRPDVWLTQVTTE
jgi:HK97 family phage portal protein